MELKCICTHTHTHLKMKLKVHKVYRTQNELMVLCDLDRERRGHALTHTQELRIALAMVTAVALLCALLLS